VDDALPFMNGATRVLQSGKYFVKSWVKFCRRRCCTSLKPWVNTNMYQRFQTRQNLTWCLTSRYQMCSHISSRCVAEVCFFFILEASMFLLGMI